jgi:hypothetical protein
MKKQHVSPVILTLVIMTIATTTLASTGYVKAQSGDTEQVKEYLNQAMQALDDDNNTLALEQVDLASDVLENMTGSADGGEEEDDNNGTTQEGAGKDAEPSDEDTNDEEDSESK